jgi:hypothetical protein
MFPVFSPMFFAWQNLKVAQFGVTTISVFVVDGMPVWT